MPKLKQQWLFNNKIQLLVVGLLAALVYLNSLQNKLLWDDHLFLEQWPDIRSFEGIPNILKGSAPEAQGKIYRPVRGIIYVIDYKLWGQNPLGYRIQAVLLHVVITLLVYFIVRELIKTRGPARLADAPAQRVSSQPPLVLLPFVTSLIFAVHPIHTETINYISTSLETFGTLFFFLSFYLYILTTGPVSSVSRQLSSQSLIINHKSLIIASCLFALLAFFTYEMTLTLPLLLVLYLLIFRGLGFARAVKSTIPYLILAGIFVLARFLVLGLVSRTDYLGYSFYHTMLTMVKVFARYIGLLIWPVNQTAIHNLVGDFPSSMIPYDSLEPVLSQTLFDYDVLLAAVLILALVAVALRYIRTQVSFVSFCILWFFISLVPVSYIIPHGGAMAEKYLYIPSFGLCLGLGYLFYYLYQLKIGPRELVRNVTIIVFIIIIVVFSGLTIVRNRVWQDDISLFSDVVKKSPGNLLANYTLGIWYSNIGNTDMSANYYQRALSKAPEFWQARFNLANIYVKTGQYGKSEDEYHKVLAVNSSFMPAKNILANLPLFKQSTQSAQLATGELFAPYSNNQGLSFFFPAYWSFEEKAGIVTIRDAEEVFSVQIKADKLNDGIKFQDYIKDDPEKHGTLINQGLAQIPSSDTAYVKIFDDNGTQKLLFFLLKGSNVIRLLAGPANLPQMREFDLILGSIKIE